MRSAPIVIALGIMGLVTPHAQAVGFGRVTTATLLGQPLNFGAAVHLDAGESLSRDCVSAEVESGDRHLPAATVRVSLEPGVHDNELLVRVTTTTLIDEPVVAVQVTVGCTGSTVSRRFVSFIDPPAMALPTAEPAAAETLKPQQMESQVAPVVAVARSLAGAEPPRRRMRDDAVEPSARRGPPRRAVVAAAAVALPASASASGPRRPRPVPNPRVKVAAAAAPEGGSRLKLEAAAFEPVAAASSPAPVTTPSTVAPSDAGAGAGAVVSETTIADEFKRLKVLEDDVNRVRAETIETQRSLVALQARLREAEEARYANALVYALATLSALLAVSVAGLWWRQSQSRGASPWWSATPTRSVRPRAPRVDSVPPAVSEVDLPMRSAKVETVPAVMDERPIPTVTEDVIPRRVAPAVSAPISPPTVFPHTQVPEQARREVSVEELIDLEQQAEFFIVLGQEEAAIDLLMGHLRSTGGASPLPYLKLLEIYRRRGDRDAYERIRGRFNRRFNAYAPDWDADLQQGRTLEEHPQLMATLQSLWSRPLEVMTTLDAALLQRDEQGEPFDLPACRELLMLYSVARDLAEHQDELPKIDLLLPLEDSESAPVAPAAAALDLDLDMTLPLASGFAKQPPSKPR